MTPFNIGARLAVGAGFLFRKSTQLGLRVINKTGSSIAANKLVAITGFDTTSGRPKIVLADADLAAHYDIWVTTAAIADQAEGVVFKGALSSANLDTSGASAAGDPVYLSGTAGAFAHTSDSTKSVVPVGFVVAKSASVGQIFWALSLGMTTSVDRQIVVTHNVPAGATAADFDGRFFIAERAYQIVSVREQHQTAGSDAGAVTLMVKKCPSGTARASGTDVLAAGINMKATADTPQSPALHGTAANSQLAAGDSLALVPTGTLTALDGVTVTVVLKQI